MIPVPLVTGAEVTFWIAGPLAVLGAIGLVTFRRAVYSALSMVLTMLSLAALYASMDAGFLFAVQIIVYTGAVMMLFVFVMMMVGANATDSVVETIKGQRVASVVATLGLLGLMLFGVGGAVHGASAGLDAANAGGNVQGLAQLLFGRYVFAFELTSALLIVAAVGAMVLAHTGRVGRRPTQRELAAKRMADYRATGAHPGARPNSGVYASTNSIAAPALLPDGTISEASVSQTLAGRDALADSPALAARTSVAFAAIEAHQAEEEE
jgi:NADH-quinone oxidoreductase subunit J